MIKFSLETKIDQPLDEVIRLFSNRDLLVKWQPGLVSSEQIENKNGHQRYKLIYQLGRRKMTMTETIINNALPEHYDVNYQLKGVFNSVNNTFKSDGPNSTKWVSFYEFRFRGLMKLIALFMKSGFEQQSKMIMHNFKAFAERSIHH